MTKKRIVITGLGIISPVGNTIDESWSNISAGNSGINLITNFDTTHSLTKIAGEVKNFSLQNHQYEKDLKRLDKFVQFGVVAGMQAVEDANLNDVKKNRVALIIGSGIGGLTTIEHNALLLESGARKISPFFIPGALANMVGGQLSIIYGFSGLNYSIVSACATGNHCIGTAMMHIQAGVADVVITGGAESAVSKVGIAGFNALKALSTRNDDPKAASRPFDIDRDGFVMGEGAGMLVLESFEHAIARDAKIYGELVGYGATSDAYHITAPNINGAVESMRIALSSADIDCESIGYINAHGTSTKIGDINEIRAIKELFQNHAKNLSVSSTKSMTGHLLGGTSAIEAIVTIIAIQNSIIPPTINLSSQDPECDLECTPNVAIQKDIEYAMSNSFGFGGTNATVIFKKFLR